MLYEIKNVKSYENEPKRRWFFGHEIDLTVWFDDNKVIIGFQLCYNKPDNPHTLTWWEKSGYHHHVVDDGEDEGAVRTKAIPILLADGLFEKNKIANLFYENSREIDPVIADFVYHRLLQYTVAGKNHDDICRSD